MKSFKLSKICSIKLVQSQFSFHIISLAFHPVILTIVRIVHRAIRMIQYRGMFCVNITQYYSLYHDEIIQL